VRGGRAKGEWKERIEGGRHGGSGGVCFFWMNRGKSEDGVEQVKGQRRV
jgi:hypothetical protein